MALRQLTASAPPTAWAAAPPTPASTSSKTIVGGPPLSTSRSANITRDSSPPDATFDKASTLDAGAAENRSSTSDPAPGRSSLSSHRDLHLRTAEGKGGQEGVQPGPEIGGGGPAPIAHLARSAADLVLGRAQVLHDFGPPLVHRDELGQALPCLLGEGQHLPRVLAVLASQLTQEPPTVLDRCEALLVGFHALAPITQGGDAVHQLGRTAAIRPATCPKGDRSSASIERAAC